MSISVSSGIPRAPQTANDAATTGEMSMLAFRRDHKFGVPTLRSFAPRTQGRRMAYYEVISLMQDQARTFDLPLADLAWEGLDPERDILSNEPVTTEPRDRRLLAAEAALMREHEQRGRARKRTVRRFLRAFDRSPDT